MPVYELFTTYDELHRSNSQLSYMEWLEESGYYCSDETMTPLLDEDRETEDAPFQPLSRADALTALEEAPWSLDALWSLFLTDPNPQTRFAISRAFSECTIHRLHVGVVTYPPDSVQLQNLLEGVRNRFGQYCIMTVSTLLHAGATREMVEDAVATVNETYGMKSLEQNQFIHGLFLALSFAHSLQEAQDILSIFSQPSSLFNDEESSDVRAVAEIAADLWHADDDSAESPMNRLNAIPSVARAMSTIIPSDDGSNPLSEDEAENLAMYAMFSMLSIDTMYDILEEDEESDEGTSSLLDNDDDDNGDDVHEPAQGPLKSVAPKSMSKDLHRLMARQSFSSTEEATEFLKQFIGRPLPEIPFDELTEEERIEDMLEEVERLPSDKQLDILRTTVRDHPNVLHAWLRLAQVIPDNQAKLDVIEQGIAIGRRRFVDSDEFADAQGHLWAVHDARPFIRLLVLNIDILYALRRVDEAIECSQEILRLNEDDNTGTRYLLQIFLLERARPHDKKRLEELLFVPNMFETPTAWNKLLFLILTKRPKDEIRTAFDEAMKRNAHVPAVLQNPNRYRDDPDTGRYTQGALDEAVYYVFSAFKAWDRTPGAFAILRSLSR